MLIYVGKTGECNEWVSYAPQVYQTTVVNQQVQYVYPQHYHQNVVIYPLYRLYYPNTVVVYPQPVYEVRPLWRRYNYTYHYYYQQYPILQYNY